MSHKIKWMVKINSFKPVSFSETEGNDTKQYRPCMSGNRGNKLKKSL